MTTGTLYIVATPIGNLDDISLRAIKTLQTVDLIAAEDTRTAQPLLRRHGISTPLISCHEHNEQHRIDTLMQRLQNGQCIALISDAGTPLINDPGYRLVQQAHKNNATIIPVPGACAAIAAISACGLPTDRFCYEGFLPKRPTERKKTLVRLKNELRTLIFYESPHRLQASVEAMRECFGDDRPACLAKELTKMHEQIIQHTLKDLSAWILSHTENIKGEFVVIVQGNTEPLPEIGIASAQHIMLTLAPYLPPKTAAAVGAELTGLKKNHLYRILMEHKQA